MGLSVLRFIFAVIFILLIASVGHAFLQDKQQFLGEYTWLALALAVTIGVGAVCADILAPRKKLSVFSGTFFGLIVGLIITFALSFVIRLLADQLAAAFPDLPIASTSRRESFVAFCTMMVGCCACYLAISVILQTKDDFRFIIPYVEFAKQTKGPRPVVVDTSALIDGRVLDAAKAGIFDTQLVIPSFVLRELQRVADSGDKLKRARGRRGLEILAKLQQLKNLDVRNYDSERYDNKNLEVDQSLMTLAKELSGRVLTTDYNLNKVAQLSGVEVLNLNELANALKVEVLPGETMTVRVIKPGEEQNQGVGFLDDGTMVVIEQGRPFINQDVEFVVTNTRQTAAGKMIFGRMAELAAPVRNDTRGDSRNDAPRNESRRPRN